MITLSAIDSWWIEVWTRLANHRRRPPTIVELSAYADRSTSTTNKALSRLELAGVFVRDARGRYVRKGWGQP